MTEDTERSMPTIPIRYPPPEETRAIAERAMQDIFNAYAHGITEQAKARAQAIIKEAEARLLALDEQRLNYMQMLLDKFLLGMPYVIELLSDGEWRYGFPNDAMAARFRSFVANMILVPEAEATSSG
jgi:hypothetical protein